MCYSVTMLCNIRIWTSGVYCPSVGRRSKLFNYVILETRGTIRYVLYTYTQKVFGVV